MDQFEQRRQMIESLRDILAKLNSKRSLAEVLDFIAEPDNRSACELHDAVTQTLFSATLIADILPELWEQDQKMGREHLAELRRLSRRALAAMQALLPELRPMALTQTDLIDLLPQLVTETLGREGLPVTVTTEGRYALPDRVQVGLYRIAQEALNNVRKHAQAGQAEAALRCSETQVELTISDNGCGFDPACVAAGRGGLARMRDRAETIEAMLTIDSRTGQGARITVVWQRPAKTTPPG